MYLDGFPVGFVIWGFGRIGFSTLAQKHRFIRSQSVLGTSGASKTEVWSLGSGFGWQEETSLGTVSGLVVGLGCGGSAVLIYVVPLLSWIVCSRG